MTSRILFILEREPAMGKDGRRDDTGKPLGKRHKKAGGRTDPPAGGILHPEEGETGRGGMSIFQGRQPLVEICPAGRTVVPDKICAGTGKACAAGMPAGGTFRRHPSEEGIYRRGKRGETPPAVQRNLWFLRGQALEDGHPGAHFPSHQHFTVFAGEADQAFIGIGKVQADIPVKTLCQEPG